MVDILTPARSVDLSSEECWQLYVLLGDAAPFVRNQLSVIRHGGRGAVSVSTGDERQQVLAALASPDNGPLSAGLQSLQTALAGTGLPRRAP